MARIMHERVPLAVIEGGENMAEFQPDPFLTSLGMSVDQQRAYDAYLSLIHISLGLSAGRKNARICHRITGEQATTEVQIDILKRVANASNGSSTIVPANKPSVPSGRYGEIG